MDSNQMLYYDYSLRQQQPPTYQEPSFSPSIWPPGYGGIGRLQMRVDRLEQQFDRLNRQVDRLDRRLSRIESFLGIR